MLSNAHGKKMIAELDRTAKSFDPRNGKEKIRRSDGQLGQESRPKYAPKTRTNQHPKELAFPDAPQREKPTYENERNPTVLYNGMNSSFRWLHHEGSDLVSRRSERESGFSWDLSGNVYANDSRLASTLGR